ncbi:TPA: general secretion pathway protein [Stenotrophomonas maltophilia]|uniref:hypothetical protein n=1 Tax=Stenotrophomonas maltophilia TaxID=40324 RepID=UPI0031B90C66|nr:general secretion pathway protein [Stenotrophomonas maltophilia]HDS1559969.1 general secretion pathway protein [Stenotrophomonas maltophilia]
MDGRRWDRNHLLTLLAATLLLAVMAYWGIALFAAGPPAAASAVRPSTPARPPFDAAASAPLVRLLSPGAIHTEVVVLGVMATAHAPLALLSVDGGAVDAYVPGQRLGPSTVLASIGAETIELQQAGRSRSLPVPALPPVPADGIVPAAAGRH